MLLEAKVKSLMPKFLSRGSLLATYARAVLPARCRHNKGTHCHIFCSVLPLAIHVLWNNSTKLFFLSRALHRMALGLSFLSDAIVWLFQAIESEDNCLKQVSFQNSKGSLSPCSLHWPIAATPGFFYITTILVFQTRLINLQMICRHSS
jgi:hypothetical protein